MAETSPYFSDWRGITMKVVGLHLAPDGTTWADVIEGEQRHRGNGRYDGETTDIDTTHLDVIERVAALPPDAAAIRAAAFEEAALTDVAAERKRQREVEGWTQEHDDEHDDRTMAAAAAAYVFANDCGVAHTVDGEEYLVEGRELWPWDLKWWKPKDRRRNLVRAAALIVAEIERLDRAAAIRAAGKK